MSDSNDLTIAIHTVSDFGSLHSHCSANNSRRAGYFRAPEQHFERRYHFLLSICENSVCEQPSSSVSSIHDNDFNFVDQLSCKSFEKFSKSNYGMLICRLLQPSPDMPHQIIEAYSRGTAVFLESTRLLASSINAKNKLESTKLQIAM